MKCPKCQHENPAGQIRCEQCGNSLDISATATFGAASVGGWAAPVEEVSLAAYAPLQSGHLLAGRYEVLEMLGEGGMGAVYKARDQELDRMVAIKVIRPELAGRPEILRRFKQELILARKVTHRNVIRIFDLGQAGPLRFITMEYLQGQDLKHHIKEKGRVPHRDAAEIVKQIGLALEAAHAEGVVHRDLKPHNVMMESSGRIVVMDFGVARSMESPGMTQTGAVMGTPEYMSPEQAKGEKVDTRSDLFTLGVIFYELLTGQSPYKAETAMGTLLKRIQERARPPIEVDGTVPAEVSDIVTKSLARETTERYQTASEMLRDLDSWMGVGKEGAAPPRRRRLRLPRVLRKWKWVAAGAAAAVVVAAGGLLLFNWRTAPRAPAPGKAISVLVADFQNATGETVFDGTLEPMFAVALEGASFINSLPRGQAQRIAAQVQAGAVGLDEKLARLVAQREGINVVVTGSIEKDGSGYRVSVRAVDAISYKPIASAQTRAADKEKVLQTVGKLAAPIRNALGDATPESLQLAAAETFTAGSMEAAQLYAKGQELRFGGRAEDAIRVLTRAVELDPTFASAYAALAPAYLNLGKRQEAEKYFQLAMSHSNRMTDREKYRARGGYYTMVRNPDKAIEEFTALLKQYPVDSAGMINLGLAYYYKRDFGRALQESRRGLEVYPKNALYRNNVAHYAMYSGDFGAAAREARANIESNPGYFKSYLALALSELAQGEPDKAAATYRRLEAVSPPVGASFAALGLADIAIYDGRIDDAIALLEKTVAADVDQKDPAAAARKFVALAEANLLVGKKGPALAAGERAAGLSRELSVLFLAARAYLEAGQEAKAQALSADLSKRLQPDPQAYGKLIDGEILLHRGKAREALTLFQEAQKVADTWVGRFNLGLAYLQLAAFMEAETEFDHCLERRGEATEAFLDEVPTYHYLPLVHYYKGRAREGLKSPGAAESYKAFLAIKAKGQADSLVLDARKRLGGG